MKKTSFFGLSIVKIILAIIILVVLIYLFPLKTGCRPIDSANCKLSFGDYFAIIVVAGIPAAVISYLISCILVYIYNKLRQLK